MLEQLVRTMHYLESLILRSDLPCSAGFARLFLVETMTSFRHESFFSCYQTSVTYTFSSEICTCTSITQIHAYFTTAVRSLMEKRLVFCGVWGYLLHLVRARRLPHPQSLSHDIAVRRERMQCVCTLCAMHQSSVQCALYADLPRT